MVDIIIPVLQTINRNTEQWYNVLKIKVEQGF